MARRMINNLVLNAFAVDRAIEIGVMTGAVTAAQANNIRRKLVLAAGSATAATGYYTYRSVKYVAKTISNYAKLQSVANLPKNEQVKRLRSVEETDASKKAKFSHTIDPKRKQLAKPSFPMSKRLRTDDEDTEMDSADGSNTQLALRSAATGSGDSKKGSQETPITPHAPSYGLPETQTVILPVTMYFGVGGLDHGTPASLTLRMNSIYDIVTSAIAAKASGDAITKQVTNNIMPYGNATTHLDPATNSFPAVYTGPPIAAWREYFRKLYDVYAVLKCSWKLTVKNCANQPSENAADIMVGWGYETFGANSTGNIFPPNAVLDETFSWPDINYKVVHGHNNDQAASPDICVISGTYTPGQADRNVKNDEDVKTWTPTISSGSTTNLPVFSERLKLMFWRAPMSYTAPAQLRANCMLQVKYIVQFKDLSDHSRYPTSTIGSSLVQTLPADALVSH